MIIIFDFITFANSAVSRVTIYDRIVFTHQLNGLVNIVNIGWSPCNGMDIAASGIDSGMHFHPVVPLVALFCLMHLRVTFALLVLSGTWSCDDCSVND